MLSSEDFQRRFIFAAYYCFIKKFDLLHQQKLAPLSYGLFLWVSVVVIGSDLTFELGGCQALGRWINLGKSTLVSTVIRRQIAKCLDRSFISQLPIRQLISNLRETKRSPLPCIIPKETQKPVNGFDIERFHTLKLLRNSKSLNRN
jgi:hypothetical protein